MNSDKVPYTSYLQVKRYFLTYPPITIAPCIGRGLSSYLCSCNSTFLQYVKERSDILFVLKLCYKISLSSRSSTTSSSYTSSCPPLAYPKCILVAHHFSRFRSISSWVCVNLTSIIFSCFNHRNTATPYNLYLMSYKYHPNRGLDC